MVNKDYILKLCEEGRLSAGKAAEVLNVSIYDIQRKAKENGILLTADEDQVAKSRKLVEKLGKRK